MSDPLAMVFKTSGCGDKYVVHVYDYISRGNFFSKDGVHHCLERGWGISESKEHYSGLVESFVAFEGSFPFVSFFNVNIVVSPSYVKLGEPLFSHKFVNKFLDEGQWVRVPDGPFIDLLVVLDWSW